MNGTWTGTAKKMTFETAYDFKAGKTAMAFGSETKESTIKMVKCSDDMAIFTSGGKEITAKIKDDTHMTLMKSGGLATEMTKKSDDFTIKAPPKAEPEPVEPASADDTKSSTSFDKPPSADELRADLIGYTNREVWNFDTPSEIKEFRIESKEQTEKKVVYKVFIVIQGTEMAAKGTVGEATANFTYEDVEGKWERASITDWKVEKKKQP